MKTRGHNTPKGNALKGETKKSKGGGRIENRPLSRDDGKVYKTLFETTQNPVLFIDLAGGITNPNRAALQFFRTTRKGIEKKNIRQFHLKSLEPGAENASFDQTLKKGGLAEMRHSLRGKAVVSEWTLIPTVLKTKAIIFAIGKDVTAHREAEETLERERNLLRTLMDNIPDGIFAKNIRGRYILLNMAEARLLGADHPGELLGKTESDFYPSKLSLKHEAEEKAVLRSGQAMVNQEEPYADSSGSIVWRLTTKVPLQDRYGKTVGIVGIGRDITEIKRVKDALSHQRYLLDALLSTIPDSIYFKDAESRFICNSDAHARKFGLSNRERLIGKSDFDFFSYDHAGKAYEDEQSIMRTGEPIVGIEEKETYPDGRVTWASTTKMPLKDIDGNTIGTFGISRDITRQKETELKLQETAQSLKRSNADLEQFAYVASHDLQEPLRMVSSYLELFKKHNNDQVDPQSQEYIGYAVDGARRMHDLVDDLRYYFEVMNQGRSFQSIKTGEVLSQVLSRFAGLVQKTGARVTHGDLPVVKADGVQLECLFRNMIENAIKYCPDKKPEVHVKAEYNGREWIFSVADNGIGIDKRHHIQIFGIFKRLHARYQFSGTGIGLALCKSIVERHGGRIWVESEEGKGSVFRFTLHGGE